MPARRFEQIDCEADAQHRRERQDRADGEVDPGDHNDESFADGNDSNDRGGKEQVLYIDPAEKHRAGNAQQYAADDDDYDQAEVLEDLDHGLVAGTDLAKKSRLRSGCFLRVGIHC